MVFNITSTIESILFKDSETRFLIPNKLSDVFINNVLSQIPDKLEEGVFEAGATSNLSGLFQDIMNLPFLMVSVQDLNFHKEHVIPRSKGIGSIGEVLHFIGPKNEEITASFMTDQYPGILGWFLKKIIFQALNYADIIYIIDEMTLVLPCIVEIADIRKSGEYEGVVQGSLELIALAENTSRTTLKSIRNLKSATSASLRNVGASTVVGTSVLATGLINLVQDLT